MKKQLTEAQVKTLLENKLLHFLGVSAKDATYDQFYRAVALILVTPFVLSIFVSKRCTKLFLQASLPHCLSYLPLFSSQGVDLLHSVHILIKKSKKRIIINY